MKSDYLLPVMLFDSAGSEVYDFDIQGAKYEEVRFPNLCSQLLIHASGINLPYCRLNCYNRDALRIMEMPHFANKEECVGDMYVLYKLY